MVTIARSRDISGPYESNPANPILTHRSTSNPVQSTGHADLVELSDGSWAMVHLGTRPRGSFPRWHTNGRETFLVGVDWVDDWPVVVSDRYAVPEVSEGFIDEFTGAALHHRWIAPGADPSSFAFPTAWGLELRAGRSAESAEAVHLLATRVVDEEWTASVTARGDVALTVRIDDAHQASLERVGEVVTARIIIGPVDHVLGMRTDLDEDAELSITAIPFGGIPGQRKGPDRLVLGADGGGGFVELASFDGRYISTEVAGGFTGRVVGVEALGGNAVVTRFAYSPS